MAPIMLDRDTRSVRKKRKAQLAIAPNVPCIRKFARSKLQKEKDKSDKWGKLRPIVEVINPRYSTFISLM